MAGHAHARIGGERGEHVVEAAQVHNDKRTALLIAVLALFLALVETGGKGAQTTALSANIEASDLWAFFQARTVRQTVVRTAAEMAPLLADPARAAEVEAQVGRWRADERRWESEPEKGDGRRELAERAKAAERARDRAMAAHHLFEVGSGALQVAIVVASQDSRMRSFRLISPFQSRVLARRRVVGRALNSDARFGCLKTNSAVASKL